MAEKLAPNQIQPPIADLHEDLSAMASQRRGRRGPNLINRRSIDDPGRNFRIWAYGPDSPYANKVLGSDAGLIRDGNVDLVVTNIYADPEKNFFDREQYPWHKRFYERLFAQRSDVIVPV